MREVRCPMCGKNNPEDQDICQYCQARLTPLVVGDDASEWPKQQPFIQPEDQSTNEGEGLPDWLKSMRSEEPDPSAAEPESESLPEWLQDVRSEPVEEEAPSEDELPDWLSDFRQEDLVSESEYGNEPDEDTWSTDQGISGGEDLPDWLVAMGVQSGVDGPEEEAEEELSMPVEGEQPDWLEQLGGQSAPPHAVEPFTYHIEGDQFVQSLETGMDEAADAYTSSETPIEEQPPEDESSKLPAWIAGLGVTAIDETHEATPDWLKDIEESPISSQEGVIERPDWLPIEEEVRSSDVDVTGVDADQPVLEDEIPGEEIIEPYPDMGLEEEAIPDWLDELISDGAVPVAALGEEGENREDDVPDWLAGYDESEAFVEELPVETEEGEPALDMDWLETQSDEVPEMEAAPFPEERVVSVSPFYEEDEEIQPLFTDDVPDWLGEPLQVSDVADLEIELSEKQEDELAPAELPAWLAAMRPIEAAAPILPTQEESERYVEGSGPLVGLRSVLPSEYDESGIKVAPTYSVKLQVSESQKAHADLVEEMIKSEGQAGEIPSRRVLGSQQLLFIGIFVVLLIALIWPVARGSQDTALPFFTQEVFETSSLIGNLPGNAPVLLAVDYEPGLSGEMEATANAVVDHLMLKGAYLALVTTKPSGPPLAERLIQGVSERGGHTYQDAVQYTNLGFIPGGQAGMRNFAEAPQRLAPYAIDGSFVWQNGPLASIGDLSDFAIVLVITEDPNTARAWIEQVQPTLEDTPMVMVVSAQAEPVVRPYYEATPKQVQGMIAGLPGGATYESMIGRSGLARNYWDAYSFGVSLIALAIVIGGTINIIMAFLSNRQQAM